MHTRLKGRLNTHILAASIVASMFASTYAVAQEAPADSQTDDSVEEVVVYGTALQTRRSIDAKRANKQISDVVGIDAIGKLPDSNVAEAASRLPGLSVVRDQQTGEGAYLTVRGLDSTLNSYSVNGVRMGTADSSNRAVALQVLPPDGVKYVEVKKSLTPDMDGDALGGAVNVELPTAFDYDGFHAAFNADMNYHERSEKLGKTFSGAIADTFGENFGIYVGGYYGKKDSVAEETENEGDWMPFHPAASEEYVDPRSYMMQGLGLDLFENTLERWGVNISADYRYGDDSEFHIRGQHNRYQDDEVHNWLDVRNQGSPRLKQVDFDRTDLDNPMNSIIGHDSVLGNIYNYTIADIVDADGDGIITDADATSDALYTLNGRSGTWDPVGMRLWRGVEHSISEQRQTTVTVGGTHKMDRLTVDYDLSYAKAEKNTPSSEGIEFGFSTKQPWLGNRGISFSFPDPRYPQWQLNQAGLEGLFDFSNFPFDDAWADTSSSSDEKKIAQINFAYEPGNDLIKEIKFGGKYTVSKRRDSSANLGSLSPNGDLTMADATELLGDDYETFFDGQYSGYQSFGKIFDGYAVSDAIRNCSSKYFQANGSTCSYDPSVIGQTGEVGLKEEIFAGYLMGDFEFGADKEWELITGVRWEHTKLNHHTVRSSNISDPVDITEKHSYDNVLPSAHLLYKPSENIIWRAAAWKSFVRPEYGYITGGISETYEMRGGEPYLIGIQRSNLKLKPQKAMNFDLGFEYYIGKSGMFSVGAYYKDISDYLVVDKTNTESLSSDGIEITEPLNLDKASLKGIEIGYTQNFDMLPEPFNGLGMVANVTFQDSEGENVDNWRTDTPPFVNAPDKLLNFILYYEKNGWEGRLSYQYSDLYLEDPRGNGVDKYIQPTTFLDFTLSYYWEKQNIRFTFQAKNLTEEHLYWATRGVVNGYQKDYVEAGRTFNFGISWKY